MKQTKYLVLDIETTGLNAWFGNRITCICAKTNTGKEFKLVHKDEIELLSQFDDWCEIINKDHIIVTKNGKMFDIPFLMARSKINHYEPLDMLNLLYYKHYDLQEITKKRVSLDDMATILGYNNKLGSGLDAIMWWKKKCYRKLRDYCWMDVLLTEKIYLHLMEKKK